MITHESSTTTKNAIFQLVWDFPKVIQSLCLVGFINILNTTVILQETKTVGYIILKSNTISMSPLFSQFIGTPCIINKSGNLILFENKNLQKGLNFIENLKISW